MTQYLSYKLKVLSFASIMLVLYIHSDFKEPEISNMLWINNVQVLLSKMIGRCAVPLFYMISGYLFFLKVPNGMRSIFDKMRKRIKTLFIPYIIGCLFFVAFSVLVAITPGTSKFINNSIFPLFKESWIRIIASVFYDTGTGEPLAFQLWFLRDLILIVLISPIWYLGLKKMGVGLITIVFGTTFLNLPYIPSYAMFWFLLGGEITKYSNKINKRNKGVTFALLFMFISISQMLYSKATYWEELKIPIILLGIIGIWTLYDKLVDENFSLVQHRWLSKACQYTFFIYLFHEPTLNIIRKLVVFVIGKNEVGYILSYMSSPFIFAIFAVVIGVFLKKYCKTAYYFCTGGR